jgi:hypothetical protein
MLTDRTPGVTGRDLTNYIARLRDGFSEDTCPSAGGVVLERAHLLRASAGNRDLRGPFQCRLTGGSSSTV